MNIKQKINNADIISFDIFDTLLFRPYVRPDDLFLHLEKAFAKPHFYITRVYAEQTVRQKTSREDVTFDEIYAELGPQFQDMKQRELDWEEMVLSPNVEMAEIWRQAKSLGKKIVVASDMYLPTDFIAKVLAKNGFGDYDKLYVSGDLGKTKYMGTLFEQIIQDTGVPANKILHIGDNKLSDYKSPKKHGIKSVLYPHMTKHFIKHNNRINVFYRNNYGNLGASILISTMAIRQHNRRFGSINKNYWYNLGYEYAGPVIYGYTRFIEKIAYKNNLEHLMFVARDGYTLQKVFQTFNNEIPNSYVYAPRLLNLIYRLDYAKDSIKQSGAIINYFCQKDKKLNDLFKSSNCVTWQDYHKFIQDNKDVFIKYASQEYENYKKYLKAYTNNAKNIGVIDTITEQFSSQKLIENTLGIKTVAIYWSVLKHAVDGIFEHQDFIYNNGANNHAFTKNWDFMELLMTAPEYPINNVTADGKPVYTQSPTADEQFRKQIYPDIANGAIDFANYIKDTFGGYDIYLSAQTLISYVNCFIDFPTKSDILNMSNIKHAYDSGHSDYRPIFSVKTPIKFVLHEPSAALRLARDAMWRTPLQTIAVCIFSPIKVHMRGIKKFEVILLPKLHNSYMQFMINTYKCRYGIQIGNQDED